MNRDRPDCAIDQRAASRGPLAMRDTLVRLSMPNGDAPKLAAAMKKAVDA
jgi:hypothetical protein